MILKFSTQIVNIETDEQKKAVCAIVAYRKKAVVDCKDEFDLIIDSMKKKCPKLAEQLLLAEVKLKKAKQDLKASKDGIEDIPYSVVCDLIAEPSEPIPGIINFVDKYTGVIMKSVEGSVSEISMPDIEE